MAAKTRTTKAKKLVAKTRNAARRARPKRAAKTTNVPAVIKTPPAPEVTWEGAVAEGKRLVDEGKRLVATADQMLATADENDWALAALADAVATRYKEKSLARFANEIGIAPCTLARRRTTYRHWKGIIQKNDPGRFSSMSYTVARTLEKHPDREALVKANPGMTKREAADLMKRHLNPDDSEMKRWWHGLISRMNKAEKDEDYLGKDRQDLIDVIKSPVMLNRLREAGLAWIRLADCLEKLFAEPANEELLESAA
jgi:hypothetical protein